MVLGDVSPFIQNASSASEQGRNQEDDSSQLITALDTLLKRSTREEETRGIKKEPDHQLPAYNLPQHHMKLLSGIRAAELRRHMDQYMIRGQKELVVTPEGPSSATGGQSRHQRLQVPSWSH